MAVEEPREQTRLLDLAQILKMDPADWDVFNNEEVDYGPRLGELV